MIRPTDHPGLLTGSGSEASAKRKPPLTQTGQRRSFSLKKRCKKKRL